MSEKCRATFIDNTEGVVAESKGHLVSGTSSSIEYGAALYYPICLRYKILFRGIKYSIELLKTCTYKHFSYTGKQVKNEHLELFPNNTRRGIYRSNIKRAAEIEKKLHSLLQFKQPCLWHSTVWKIYLQIQPR